MSKFRDKDNRSFFNIMLEVKYSRLLIPTIIAIAVGTSCLNLYTSRQERYANSLKLSNQGFLLYITLRLLFSVLEYTNALLAIELIEKAYQKTVRMFYDQYTSLNYVDFMKLGIGSVQASIDRRSDALIKFMKIIVLRFAVKTIYLAVILSRLAAYISLPTALKAGAVLLFFFAVLSAVQYKRAKLRLRINRATDRSSQKLLDVLINYERIRAYSNEDVEIAKYHRVMDERVYYRRIYEVLYDVIAMVTTMTFLLVFVTIYHCLNTIERVTKEDLDEVIFTSFKLNSVVIAILQDLNTVYTSYFDFMSTGLDDGKVFKKDDESFKFGLHRITDRIDVINLNLYLEGNRILKDVNCTIKRGEKVAICGPSSAGKSVFLKTLLGMYPYRGAVIFDGYEQKQIRTASLHANIGYIPQEPQLFDATIMENLKMGNDELSDEKVMGCCEIFRMHGVFKSLGYNKRVGPMGQRLSGGQKQKLVFMRTVLKASPLFLLDHATSALDIQTERWFIDAMKTYLTNTTVIAAVKNVRTLDDFDRVFFFKDGKIKAEGTFEEITNDSFEFAEFYKMSIAESKL